MEEKGSRLRLVWWKVKASQLSYIHLPAARIRTQLILGGLTRMEVIGLLNCWMSSLKSQIGFKKEKEKNK